MYYHLSSELCVEVTRRLQIQEDRYVRELNTYDNCGILSPVDSLRDSYLVEERVLRFIVPKLVTEDFVSIESISESLNIPEKEIVSILKKNGLELTIREYEEEGGEHE